MGGAILQNELLVRLPESVKDTLPGLDNVAYAVIPLVPGLPAPEKAAAQRAFAEALALVWRVLIAFAAAGLAASLAMRGLPLHTLRDETYAMRPVETDPDGNKLEENEMGRVARVGTEA